MFFKLLSLICGKEKSVLRTLRTLGTPQWSRVYLKADMPFGTIFVHHNYWHDVTVLFALKRHEFWQPTRRVDERVPLTVPH
jgi:hypothetical protein